jgi:hypothetical protein
MKFGVSAYGGPGDQAQWARFLLQHLETRNEVTRGNPAVSCSSSRVAALPNPTLLATKRSASHAFLAPYIFRTIPRLNFAARSA